MIEMSALNRHYMLGGEPVLALNDLSLNISAGDYISIMGPSGSGKSTLLNQLGLLDRPNSGSYRLNKIETTNLTEAERAALRNQSIGFVFQAYHLIDRLTAQENVELPLTLAGVPSEIRHTKSKALLTQLGLGDFLNQRPMQLSGGQRQRVSIARAVITEPDLLLADEPTGNLDSISGQKVVDLLESLNQQGITLIIVTHDAELGARANRQIQLTDGKLIADIYREKTNATG